MWYVAHTFQVPMIRFFVTRDHGYAWGEAKGMDSIDNRLRLVTAKVLRSLFSRGIGTDIWKCEFPLKLNRVCHNIPTSAPFLMVTILHSTS